MDIVCPHCRQTLEGDDSLVGADVTCPGCNRGFTVPKIVAIGSAPTVIPQACPVRNGRAVKWFAIGVPLVVLCFLVIVLARHILKGSADGASASGHREGFARAEQCPVRNPTESEKMAMGRVFYQYAKIEVLMSQLAAAGGDESEAAGAQLLAGLGGGIMPNDIDTTGCPDDFAAAWKEYAAAIGALKVIETSHGFLLMTVNLAWQQGLPVDMETQTRLAEFEELLPKARLELEEKKDAFFSVCQLYGMENVQKWSFEAIERYESPSSGRAGDISLGWRMEESEIDPEPPEEIEPIDVKITGFRKNTYAD